MSEILDILKKTNTIISGSHFVLTNGGHADTYINKDALYPHTGQASAVGRLFAEKAKDLDLEIVVAPGWGGIILSQWTAYHLSKIKGREILGVYSDKMADGRQVLRRGYDKLVKGKNILIVEDLTSTGASAKKAMKTVEEAGGKIIAVSVMINRNPKGVTSKYFGVPFLALDDFEVKAYEEKKCELCKANIPINITLGHGKKYLESHK